MDFHFDSKHIFVPKNDTTWSPEKLREFESLDTKNRILKIVLQGVPNEPDQGITVNLEHGFIPIKYVLKQIASTFDVDDTCLSLMVGRLLLNREDPVAFQASSSSEIAIYTVNYIDSRTRKPLSREELRELYRKTKLAL